MSRVGLDVRILLRTRKKIYKYAKEYIIIFPLKCVHKCNLCNKLFMKFRVLGEVHSNDFFVGRHHLTR